MSYAENTFTLTKTKATIIPKLMSLYPVQPCQSTFRFLGFLKFCSHKIFSENPLKILPSFTKKKKVKTKTKRK